ncbi:MAG: PfkB family carbohydrate kinase, partial [Bacteriovoracaceae bacterium]
SSFQIIPTVANNVFDVSGAGDTAISLLMASYLSGATLEEASWIGNCGAGVVVGKNGTATVALDELSQFHNHLANTLQ